MNIVETYMQQKMWH